MKHIYSTTFLTRNQAPSRTFLTENQVPSRTFLTENQVYSRTFLTKTAICPTGDHESQLGRESVCDGLLRGPGGDLVNEFPIRRQVHATAPAGCSPPQLDTKTRRPGGTRKRPLRGLHEKRSNSQTLNSQTHPLLFVLGRRLFSVPRSGISWSRVSAKCVVPLGNSGISHVLARTFAVFPHVLARTFADLPHVLARTRA